MFRIILVISLLISALSSQAAIVVGDPKGDITMVFVYDYQCPHCQRDYPVVRRTIAQHPHLKVKMMPTAIINHQSIYQAAAVIAAAKQSPKKFKKLTDAWLSNGHLSKRQIDRSLSALGLDSKQFKQSMHQDWVRQQMVNGLNLLKHVNSGKPETPVFVIYPTNSPKVSKVLKGSQSYQRLNRLIEGVKRYGS